jgi:hypothetical protein
VEGKAILVTGHDMHDLDLLLQQTEGKVGGCFEPQPPPDLFEKIENCSRSLPQVAAVTD